MHCRFSGGGIEREEVQSTEEVLYLPSTLWIEEPSMYAQGLNL